MKRSLELTPELLRLYSRRGNFHSDPDAAADIGYDQLVAQGMQVAGPAYGLLLEAWGEEFLAHGTLIAEVRRHGHRRRDRRRDGGRRRRRRVDHRRRAGTAPSVVGNASLMAVDA